jgi:hypothetical protein
MRELECGTLPPRTVERRCIIRSVEHLADVGSAHTLQQEEPVPWYTLTDTNVDVFECGVDQNEAGRAQWPSNPNRSV